MIRSTTIAAVMFGAALSVAQAAPIASVALSGSSFLQAGSVTNSQGEGHSIVRITYTLGTPEVGVATWETEGSGTASDFLSDPNWFQTVTWSGLNIADGDSFNFGGLDIELIASLAPLVIDQGTIDNVGTSLRNASVTVEWSNGAVGSEALNLTGWTVNNSFRVVAGDANVPEPASLLLVGLGLLGAAVRARRKA